MKIQSPAALPLHRPVAQAAASVLARVLKEMRAIDRSLEWLAQKEKRLGGRDRRQVALAVYELTRHWRRYARALDPERELHPRDASSEDLIALICLWWMENSGSKSPPGWISPESERVGLLATAALGRLTESRPAWGNRENLPAWIDAVGVRELGESAWEKQIAGADQPAPAVLRAHSGIISAESLAERLKQELGVCATRAPHTRDGLILERNSPLSSSEFFRKGWFEFQDGSSQQVVEMLDPKPGETVVDVCAGAGGKTLHIASLMKGKGAIWALDTSDRRLNRLAGRAERLRLRTLRIQAIENGAWPKELSREVDRVLLDVPCSGLGTLRRKPETLWHLEPENLPLLTKTQSELLKNYSPHVRPGGVLVYSTCSILPSENQAQVQSFLASAIGRRFQLVGEKSIAIGENGYDGFYMAKLLRTTRPNSLA